MFVLSHRSSGISRLIDGLADALVNGPRATQPPSSVSLDDDLLRGLVGAALRKLLRDHAADGRTEFSHREPRLAPEIGDNLEARLGVRVFRACPSSAPKGARSRRKAQPWRGPCRASATTRRCSWA
ncbi:MAG: hypothetical protein C0505_01235 [Leptothrix sp. (in: Bacteria)]|nr:hypothetical protein [Leptothrix sp. (in: b-proteobacteria)]